MNILLTGNEGYIGIVVGEALVAAGHTVTGFDTGYYASGWLYNGPKPLTTVIRKDIRNIELIDLQGIDAVVHLAELSNDPLGQNDPELTFDINHRGTVKLIDLAKQAGVKRFIYYSSCSVYGASDKIADETSATNPLTAYAKSKVLNEDYLLKVADENFSPLIFRNSTVYGASPRMRFDLVVNNLAGLAFTTHEVKMDSDGTPWRPFVHVQDVAAATVLALKTPISLTHKQIINIGNNRSNYQIKEIANIVASVIPDCTVSLNPNGADKRNYRVNFDKVTKILPGFNCAWDVEKGTAQLLAIFSQINFSKEMFASNDFTRLKTIQNLKDTGKLDEKLYWKGAL